MDTPGDDDNERLRSAAYRAAQKSSSNVFPLRRLKWAALPTQFGRVAARRPVLSITGLLALVIVAAVIGFIAVSVWPVVLAALT